MDDGTRTHDGRNHNPGLYQLSYVHHRPAIFLIMPAMASGNSPLSRLAAQFGAPGRTRTCDPRLRRPMLYPAELRAQSQPAVEYMVGAEGFEPPTLCSQSRCATRLRHAPPEAAPARGANHTCEVRERQFGGERFAADASATPPECRSVGFVLEHDPGPGKLIPDSIRFLEVACLASCGACRDQRGDL